MIPPERMSELLQRTRGWIPRDQWGPVCAGCGGDGYELKRDHEFRIDGYCSIECRDFHSDEDVEYLLNAYRRLMASIMAHHEFGTLSEDTFMESVGGPCQVCARAQRASDAREIAEKIRAEA